MAVTDLLDGLRSAAARGRSITDTLRDRMRSMRLLLVAARDEFNVRIPLTRRKWSAADQQALWDETRFLHEEEVIRRAKRLAVTKRDRNSLDKLLKLYVNGDDDDRADAMSDLKIFCYNRAVRL